MRYADLAFNEGVIQTFLDRTKIIKSIRQTLDDDGFCEVEGPTLHTIAGGAAATATKFGLFKFLGKMWKVLIIAVLGFLAALKNKIKSLFTGKESVHVPGELEKQDPSPHQTESPKQDANPDGQ